MHVGLVASFKVYDSHVKRHALALVYGYCICFFDRELEDRLIHVLAFNRVV